MTDDDRTQCAPSPDDDVSEPRWTTTTRPQQFSIHRGSDPTWELTAPEDSLTVAELIQLRLLEGLSAALTELTDLLTYTVEYDGERPRQTGSYSWRVRNVERSER